MYTHERLFLFHHILLVIRVPTHPPVLEKQAPVDTPVFLNTKLTFRNKPLFNGNFITKGLRTEGDLIGENGELLDAVNYLHKFSIEQTEANTLLLERIVECVPHEWKRALINDQHEYKAANYLGVIDAGQQYRFVLVSKFNIRRLYLLLLKAVSHNAIVVSLRRWKAVFHNDQLTVNQLFATCVI